MQGLTEKEYDVVVVGAGPAGLAASSVAAESGARVLVLESGPWVGGQIWRQSSPATPTPQARKSLERFRQSGARLARNATVIGISEARSLRVETSTEAVMVSWRKLILATGARELFLPFPGWTLPQVTGVGALQLLVKSGLPVAGKRVVLAGTGPLLLAVGAQLKQAGAQVLMIAEQADWGSLMRFGLQLLASDPGKLLEGARLRARLAGVPHRMGCWPVSAAGTDRVESVIVTDGRSTWTLPCDYLGCAFGLVPNLELPALLGCAMEHRAVRVNALQETSLPDVYAVGEVAGIGGVDCALAEGEIAGYAAAGKLAHAEACGRRRLAARRFAAALQDAFALRSRVLSMARPETIVCRCEDVSRQSLEDYRDWREAKLQTRCGMGPCQGRVCGAALQALRGWEVGSPRPPVYPTRLSSLIQTTAEPPLSTNEPRPQPT